MIVLMVVVEYTTRVVTLLCMCIILCEVEVIIFNAIERYVSCVMVVRVGAKVHGATWMYVGSRVYVCRNVCMMLCVCILVCLCACICPHMYVCGVSICVCLYVCGGADLAWMMGLES